MPIDDILASAQPGSIAALRARVIQLHDAGHNQSQIAAKLDISWMATHRIIQSYSALGLDATITASMWTRPHVRKHQRHRTQRATRPSCAFPGCKKRARHDHATCSSHANYDPNEPQARSDLIDVAYCRTLAALVFAQAITDIATHTHTHDAIDFLHDPQTAVFLNAALDLMPRDIDAAIHLATTDQIPDPERLINHATYKTPPTPWKTRRLT